MFNTTMPYKVFVVMMDEDGNAIAAKGFVKSFQMSRPFSPEYMVPHPTDIDISFVAEQFRRAEAADYGLTKTKQLPEPRREIGGQRKLLSS